MSRPDTEAVSAAGPAQSSATATRPPDGASGTALEAPTPTQQPAAAAPPSVTQEPPGPPDEAAPAADGALPAAAGGPPACESDDRYDGLPTAAEDGDPGPLLPRAAPADLSTAHESQRTRGPALRPGSAPASPAAVATHQATPRATRAGGDSERCPPGGADEDSGGTAGETRTTGELRGSLSYPILPRARKSPYRITWPRAAVAGFVVLGFTSLLLQLCTVASVPTEADWLAAAQRVRADWRDGDVVRLQPAWATQGLQFLRDLELDLAATPEARRLSRHSRLWVLASHGQRCTDGAPAAASARESWQYGPLTLCRFGLVSRGKPLYDFVDRLKDAHVRRIHPKRTEECLLLRRGEWHCGKVHPWAFVGRVVKDVDDSPREGLWAHPLKGGVQLVISYPAVPMDVSGGLTLRSIHSGEGSEVHFDVQVDDKLVLRRTIRPTEKGWFHWPVDTSRFADMVVPVTFTIWAQDNQVRQFMFDGRVWKR